MLFGWGNNPFRFLSAWGFDGVNDTVSVPNSASLALLGTNGTWSISIWTRIDLIQAGTRVVLSKRNTTGGTRGIIFCSSTATYGSRFYLDFFDTVQVSFLLGPSYTIANAGQWFHHVIVRNGTNIQLWENGILVASTVSAAAVDTTAPLIFGDWGGIRFADVTLDETTLYNKALMPAEVAHLYNSGNGNAPHPSMLANLIARYSFDSAGGTLPNPILADLSGNGNNGTGQNFSVSPLIPH